MFNKYNSIENSYQEKFLDKIRNNGYADYEFVVQEKVHGANLSYWTTDGQVFKAAKRTGDILEGEKFNNYEIILEEIKPQLTALYEQLREDFPSLDQVTIFGELMGGNYPHPDVAVSKTAVKVQKGVFYCPENKFYAFDILLNGSEYLDVDVANKYFEQYNLLHAKTLFRGSLEECLKYPNDFESTLAKEFGLPEIKDNITEGVVIKPVRSTYFSSGSRLILKNKNEKWSEKAKGFKVIKKKAPLPEKLAVLVDAISGYVTENRLDNVLSKIGEVSISDFGKVMGLFSKDVIEDFLKDYEEPFNELEKADRRVITKSIPSVAAGLVRQRLRR